MTPISINGEDSLSLVMVEEYLRSPMSKDLLFKFPHYSTFDFDYGQSSIWSPLLPPNSSAALGLELWSQLSRGDTVDRAGFLENTKKMVTKFKRKFTYSVVENIRRRRKLRRGKRKSFGISLVRSGRRLSLYSSMPKAWAKVMKAAVKQFKKRMNNNNKEPNVHLYLSSCFTS